MPIDYLNILREQVKIKGSIQAVADELGYNRSSISSALSGNYPGGTGKIQAKVIATYCDRIICPHTAGDMAQETCTTFRTRTLPTSDASELRHWLACQNCPLNPVAKSTKELSHA